ncbi:hypothetical protein [Malaciobacter marinus]|nr:hypothetical protein [Malaciobacter marinus]
MKNILVIGMIIIAIGYMIVMMKNNYDNVKQTNEKINQQKKIK